MNMYIITWMLEIVSANVKNKAGGYRAGSEGWWGGCCNFKLGAVKFKDWITLSKTHLRSEQKNNCRKKEAQRPRHRHEHSCTFKEKQKGPWSWNEQRLGKSSGDGKWSQRTEWLQFPGLITLVLVPSKDLLSPSSCLFFTIFSFLLTLLGMTQADNPGRGLHPTLVTTIRADYLSWPLHMWNQVQWG